LTLLTLFHFIGTITPYPYYKHQESTGTGVDARFGSVLGSNDVKALEESTEADDLRDRQELEKQLKKKMFEEAAASVAEATLEMIISGNDGEIGKGKGKTRGGAGGKKVSGSH
jgi:hypothetical protein